jgi:putative hemolysin
MSKKSFSFLLCFTMIVVSLSGTASPQPCSKHKQAQHSKSGRVLGEFRGILPCADCSGLDTRLLLIQNSSQEAKGTYVLKEKYIDKSPFIITKGKWQTLKGNSRDPNATVYVLNPDKPNELSYFLKVDDQTIQSLDNDKNEIQSPFNLSLRIQKVGVANPASVSCIKHGGVVEMHKDKMGGEYGVCHFTDGRVCEEWALFRKHVCRLPKE